MRPVLSSITKQVLRQVKAILGEFFNRLMILVTSSMKMMGSGSMMLDSIFLIVNIFLVVLLLFLQHYLLIIRNKALY